MDHTHEDLQMHREMWAGHVPIQLELHRNEVASTQTPDTLFILAPRMGYLPIATQEAEQYFKAFAPPAVDGTDGFWLEDNGTPLKWQFPTGVLYDLHARRSQFEGLASSSAIAEDGSGPVGDLPWSITAHFRAFPAKVLIRCKDLETVKHQFQNNLKEANYLKHGEKTKTDELSLADQDVLWDGLKSNKPELYWQVNGKLRPKVSFRYVPVRVCRPFKPFIQEPVLPKHPDGTDRSLGDVLHQLIPEVVVSPTGPVRAQVLVQGITPPLETPISWLAYNCSHPDNFLYICVLQPPPTAADRLV